MSVALEIAADDVGDALAAMDAGASRIELCAALEVGGVTPGPGLLAEARAAISGELIVLCRPRRGDFVYDARTFRALVADVVAAREAGADGVAVGVLDAGGGIDAPRMRELVDAAGSLSVTCHRAFDQLVGPHIAPLEALVQLAELGFARVLTSGRAPSARDGAPALAALVDHAARFGGGLEVVAGGGVRAEHVTDLVRLTGVSSVHASASRLLRSPGAAGDASLAPSRLPAENERRAVDPDEVQALSAALRGR